MSRFDDNLIALNKRYPNLSKHIKDLKDDGTVRVIPTRKSNVFTCEVKKDNVNWLLHSKEDPQKEAEVFANIVINEDIIKANVIVCFGIGMGYYIRSIVNRYGKFDPLFIVIENNIQVFKKFIQNNILILNTPNGPLNIFEHPRFNFLVGVPSDQIYFYLYDIINSDGRNAFSTFYFIEHPVMIRFNKEYYKPVTSEISRICYDIKSSYGNDPEDSWFGIDHMLQNIDIITSNPGSERLRDKFKGEPAVIVATGPSLNKNIHLLPQLKNKCVMFAADASLNTFFNYDPIIKPDIVCSLERNLSTANHFKQIADDKKSLMKDIWLGACPVVKPNVYNEWKGKHLVIFRDFAHFKWLDLPIDVLNTGKSVTNMAFKIAEHMGCDPIILVGQDLAFAPDGQSHVRGADHARDGLAKSQLINQKHKVLGNNGQQLDSLETWVGMLKRFEFDIAKGGGTYKIINATEGGAFIKGTEVMPLQEVIDKYITKDIDTHKRISTYMIDLSENEIIDRKNAVSKRIDDGMKYIEKSIGLLNEVLDRMEGGFVFLENDIDIKSINEMLNYAEKIKDEILRDPMCYFAIMHVLQSWCMGRENVLQAIEHFYKDDELLVERYIRIFDFFYGLRILFNHVKNGIRESFYGEKVSDN